jgi:hypothetical protein
VLPPRTPGSFLDTTVWPETTFWYELRGVSADGYEEPVAAPVTSVTTGGRLVAQLFAPHPNPFSSETAMAFDVPGCAHRTSLAVYNVRGQLVRRVVEDASRGRHCALWDGSDESGHRAPSGVYFVRLDVGGSVRTRKLLLIR